MKHKLNELPTIINYVGQYKTRSGNIVNIDQIIPESHNIEFNCRQITTDYFGKIVNTKNWHKSGRISQYSESPLDIIEAINRENSIT